MLTHLNPNPTHQPARMPFLARCAPPDQAARLSRCEKPLVLSFAKERTLAVGAAIGWGSGGRAKSERLAKLLGIADATIRKAFSPHFRDTLRPEYLDALLADAGIGAAKEAA